MIFHNCLIRPERIIFNLEKIEKADFSGNARRPVLSHNPQNVHLFDMYWRYGRRNSGGGGRGQFPPTPIFCQPKKIKSLKIVTYK